MAGRVVLDGVDTLRASSAYFESYALDDVAQQLLGRGKAIDHGPRDRLAELRRMYREDPAAFARYNLEDCRLAADVFARADLFGFLIERQQLTGLPLDRPRGAVAAFDYLYLPRLHREGFVAPSVSDADELGQSPGGYVMDSLPGLYDNVLVLDFKSLYPSIIRTFFIDPLGLALSEHEPGNEPKSDSSPPRDFLPGFDGARFDRERHILPSLITTLWHARDEAKRRKDGARSQAIKILMNSFYGVLGTPGCRFHSSKLTSSITRRGHEIINKSREQIQARGLTVIYGDTDSLFVLLGPGLDIATCQARGKALAAELNVYWKDELERLYHLPSQLEIQFDTHYLRFFMPTLRDSERGSKKRYAGLVRMQSAEGPRDHVVFKGLEAVRTDWTPLARRFQRELYRRIFAGEDYEDFVRELRAQLLSGKLDAELVYRKRLRRPLDEYVKNIPPHVKAARMLEQSERFVSYVMTTQGPTPIMGGSADKHSGRATIDYAHYLERQLSPAADAILQHCGTSFSKIAGNQLSLF
jgi:DNA polymerase-2